MHIAYFLVLEMLHSSFRDITFIASYGRAVFNAMEAVDKDAIW